MSYSENPDGTVVLTLSREDYRSLLITMGYAAGAMKTNGDKKSYRSLYELLDRLHSGNPDYTPY
jgi:hypothetical protein